MVFCADIKLAWTCGAAVVLAVEEKEGNARGFRVPAEYYFSIWSVKATSASMNIRKLFGLFQYHCTSVTWNLITNPEMRKGFYDGKESMFGAALTTATCTQSSIWCCHLKLHWCTEILMVLWTFLYMRKHFSCFVSVTGTCLHWDYKYSH